MTRDDRFAQTIAALAVATRGELDDPTIELYDRALLDVPIELLETAAVELARTAKFFPKPAEWRDAVDVILDRNQRLQLAHSGGQLQLPGEVGPDQWRCPDCDGTGWVDSKRECVKTPCRPPGTEPGKHTHPAVTPCTNAFCRTRRQKAAAAQRRYGRKDD